MKNQYNTSRPSSRRIKTRDRINSRKSTAVVHVNQASISDSRTQSLQTTALLVMALKLPTSSASDPSTPSSTTSTAMPHFFYLCLSPTHVRSCCYFVLQQLCTLLVHCRTVCLPGIPSSRLNPPSKPWQRNFRSPRGENQSPSPITQRSVTTNAGPPSAKPSLPSVSKPPSQNKTRRENGQAFLKYKRSPD